MKVDAPPAPTISKRVTFERLLRKLVDLVAHHHRLLGGELEEHPDAVLELAQRLRRHDVDAAQGLVEHGHRHVRNQTPQPLKGIPVEAKIIGMHSEFRTTRSTDTSTGIPFKGCGILSNASSSFRFYDNFVCLVGQARTVLVRAITALLLAGRAGSLTGRSRTDIGVLQA